MVPFVVGVFGVSMLVLAIFCGGVVDVVVFLLSVCWCW